MPDDLQMAAPTPAAPRPERRLTGGHVLGILLAAFAVVAGVNAYMVTVATRTLSGLEVASPYEASQKYNDEIARAKAQEERGWKARAVLGGDAMRRTVTLRMLDRNEAPVTGLAVKVKLAHPTFSRDDRSVDLRETAPGVYEGALEGVPAGGRDLVIDAHQGRDQVYMSRSRVTL